MSLKSILSEICVASSYAEGGSRLRARFSSPSVARNKGLNSKEHTFCNFVDQMKGFDIMK